MPKVYLAGPIAGMSYDECDMWRKDAQNAFQGWGIEAFSPLRHQRYLASKGTLGKTVPNDANEPMSNAKGLTHRDHWDVLTCDLLFVNFLGAEEVSMGTVLEIAWAHAYKKPIIMVIEEEGNPHEHMMINEIVPFRASTLDEGLDLAWQILTP